MKDKIGLVTSFQEYNYGAMLQAFALKHIINEENKTCQIIWLKGGLIKFKDIRIKKIVCMFSKMVLHPSVAIKIIKTYKSAYSKEITKGSKNKFLNFSNSYFNISLKTYSEWKKVAEIDEYNAFICGSDQIWNSTAIYLEPMYYLQFAPKHKRIAYAPSLGKNFIPDYNKKIMKKYISSIPYLSVREKQGAELICKLIGKPTKVVLDPTFLVSKNEWIDIFELKEDSNNYILCYFLSEPDYNTCINIKSIQEENSLEIVFIPYQEDWHLQFENYKYIDVGPIEFIELVLNAQIIITDSFHGTAFSINFNKEFYTVKRQYGSNDSQESRIVNLLEEYDLVDRYIEGINLCMQKNIEWDIVNNKLQQKVSDSKFYLFNSIRCIKKQGEKYGEYL